MKSLLDGDRFFPIFTYSIAPYWGWLSSKINRAGYGTLQSPLAQLLGCLEKI